MDSPDRTQLGHASVSKIENSPVFNYISTLSPIKPFKAISTNHAFNSLSLRAVTSVFSSPQSNSTRESTVLRGPSYEDRSKPVSRMNGNKFCADQCVYASVDVHEQSDINAAHEIPRSYLQSAIDSPSINHVGIHSDCGISCLTYVQEDSKKGSYERKKSLLCEGIEGTRHGMESLFYDTGSPLIFASPDCSESTRLIQDSLDLKPKFCRGLMSQFVSKGQNYMHELPCADHSPDHSSLLEDMDELNKITPNLYNYAYSNRSMHITAEEVIYNEPASSLHNVTWRRGLDFEMAGDFRRDTEDGKNDSSSILSQSEEKKFIENNTQVVHPMYSGHLSLCILPGIGLHLNALAKNLNDCKNASGDILSSGRQLTLPCTTGQSHISSTSHEHLFTSADSERQMDSADNSIKMEEDAPQASHNVVQEELYLDSPKRKRLRSYVTGENESCKRCNCKKSKCLKLYCECFASGLYCIEPCSCQECFNKPDHQETVLATRKLIESRNPLAFAPRVIWSSDPTSELGDFPLKTPASSRHKTGCNCKKSSCLKKYCECFQGGVGCSSSCRCEGCKNAFGKKDGIEEETKSVQKKFSKSSTCTEIQNHGGQELCSALPITTPLQQCRLFTLQNQTSCSSSINAGAPSALCADQKLGKPNIFKSQPTFEKDETLVLEGVMPVYRDCSSTTNFRTASPNSKRVSPLHCNPATRIGRKLILRSIPSLPSLSPQ